MGASHTQSANIINCMSPTRVEIFHGPGMSKSTLFAMLDNKMGDLSLGTSPSLPERIVGIVHSINEERNAHSGVGDVKPGRAQDPDVQCQLRRVVKVKVGPCNLHSGRASAIMFYRILRTAATHEAADVVGRVTLLEPPTSAPAIEEGPKDRGMDTRGSFLRNVM